MIRTHNYIIRRGSPMEANFIGECSCGYRGSFATLQRELAERCMVDHANRPLKLRRTTKRARHRLRQLASSSDRALIRSLRNDAGQLVDVWNEVETGDAGLFARVVERIVGDKVLWCDDCNDPMWQDNATIPLSNGSTVCEPCRDDAYTACDRCGRVVSNDDVTGTHSGNSICDSCLESYYSHCEGCEEWFQDYNVTTVSGNTYCDRRCLGEYCTWCDPCDEYYLDGDGHDHDDDECDCEAPRSRFTFPANGDGTVRQNQRILVELPSGTISSEGIDEICQELRSAFPSIGRHSIRDVVGSLDTTWQKKSGNFTRRLSSACYKKLGVKIPAATLSEIGNIARRNTANASSFWVEFTRDLNGDAYEFCNSGSCWWGSHSNSRCALKQWGGIGLRSYATEDSETHRPMGRAWVQPLNKKMGPTHTTLEAHAYVVYNGYGNLDGYVAARIVAYLTGHTYRKVELSLDPQYVNSDTGYLVSDEVTCAKTDSIYYEADCHDTADHSYLEAA